jgi:Rrf2 family protein
MMKISTKTEYGLRCLLRLARQAEGKSLSIVEISGFEHVPKQYAQQILMCLRRAGLVKSIRGTDGGFALARSSEAISVGEVVRVLEGIPFQDTCKKFNKRSDCGHTGDCSIRPIWQMISQRLWEALDSIPLQHLVTDEKTMGFTLIKELPVLDIRSST